MSYICAVSYHLHLEPDATFTVVDLLGCQHTTLSIGDVSIWPTREQLVAIRDAIQGYLDAHPIVITPAEIVQIAQPHELTDAEVQEMF